MGFRLYGGMYLTVSPAYVFVLALPSASLLSFLRHCFGLMSWARGRIINLLSINYASRPCLRSRLTLGGSTFPRNPWSFGVFDSRKYVVTHAGILTTQLSTVLRRAASSC